MNTLVAKTKPAFPQHLSVAPPSYYSSQQPPYMLELFIKFDQPQRAFTSSDVLSGEATVMANRDTTITSIKLSCRGFAHVTSKETGGTPVEHVYWNEDVVLFDAPNSSKLASGAHKYKFSFKLPQEQYPHLPASFAYRRDASGNGIKWLVRLNVSFPKIKIRRSQSVEKPFLFFPQYNERKFEHAIPFVTFEYSEPLKIESAESKKESKKTSLRSKIKSSLLKNEKGGKEVLVHCHVSTAKQGISQAPFSWGIYAKMWATESNKVMLKGLTVTLLATQQLHYAGVTSEYKFRSEVARIDSENGEILPSSEKSPLTLAQLLKAAQTEWPFVIPRNLPGSFESRYFSQKYHLQVELTVASFYSPSATRSFVFEQPAEVLHLYIPPDENTIPVATFLQTLDAQLGLTGYDPKDTEGLPAYPGHESPPGFETDDITPVASPVDLNLRPLTSFASLGGGSTASLGHS